MGTQVRLKKSFMSRCAAIIVFCLLFWPVGCQPEPARVYKIAPALTRSGSPGPYNTGPWSNEREIFYPAPNTGMPLPGRILPGQGVGMNNAALKPDPGVYHIGPGDVVQLKINQLLDLNREEVLVQEVDRRGLIYVPMLNYVSVAGMTCPQLRQELIRRLGQEFIRDPQVEVNVQRYGSKQIMVLGAVRQPGALTLETDSALLLDVVSMAGGINNAAAPDIEIYRGAYKPDRYASNMITNAGWSAGPGSAYYDNCEIIPVSQLFTRAGEQINPLIFPGDVVQVPNQTEGFIYISGEVKQPGAKPYRRPLNIMQAVTCAGGLNFAAEEKKCKIVRRTTTGGEKVITVDLEKIGKGEQANLLLAQNDTISIPANGWKKFLEELDRLFLRVIRVGADVTYDAGGQMGIPTTGIR